MIVFAPKKYAFPGWWFCGGGVDMAAEGGKEKKEHWENVEEV